MFRVPSVTSRLVPLILRRVGADPAVSSSVFVTFATDALGFLAFLGVRRKQPTGRIVLCNLSPQIREMFEVCRLLARDELDTAAPFEGGLYEMYPWSVLQTTSEADLAEALAFSLRSALSDVRRKI